MFADRLRAAMTERGWTNQQLVERMSEHASRRTVYGWLAGEARPGLAALVALLDVLGIDRASAAAVAWQDDAARGIARESDR
jgi:transcriptional regulator with XRE-family HTH domain